MSKPTAIIDTEQQVKKNNLPQHIAVIMDGNNRWSKLTGKKGLAGHHAGADTARNLVKLCLEKGIQYLTLFAFSSENWQRPSKEVNGLMSLFLNVLQKKDVNKLHKNNIRLQFIGNRSRFSSKLCALMSHAEELTRNNDALIVMVAADYGGHWDITNAAKVLAEKVQNKELAVEQITEEVFQDHLCAGEFPLPDLCIRTGGEQRISNFLLWQLAYAELYFTPTFWPDFDEIELERALADFAGRQRRYGKASEQIEAELTRLNLKGK